MADEKTVAVVAIADDVGYTDSDGVAHYASRGQEFDIPEKDYERHGVRTPAEIAAGNYPAVVKADHPSRDQLVQPITGAEDPRVAYGRLQALHGAGPSPLLDPAMRSVEEPSTVPARAQRTNPASQIDFTKLDKESLKKVAEAMGEDDSGTKDELVARLNAASGSAGLTPRQGATSDAAGDEAGSSSVQA